VARTDLKPISKRPGYQAYGRLDQMLQIAAELFSDRGYHGTTVRDIAGKAGILSGSLYAHIRSKEDLLYEIVRRAADQFISSLEALRTRPNPPSERLRLALRAHVEVVAEHPERARVFLHEWTALRGKRRAEVRRLRDRYEALWGEILGDVVPTPDAKYARLLVLSAANWTYTWYRPDGPLSPEEVADRFTDLLLDGLGTKEGSG